MFGLSFKALVVSSSLFVSIPINPDIPKPIKPDFKFSLPKTFPLDDEVEVYIDLKIADRESKITMTFLVEEKEDKKYLYSYTVTNSGKYPVAFRYSVLDEISGAEIILIYLESGESRKVTVKNDKSPIYAEGIVQVWLMVKPDDEIWKEDIKKAGATVDGNFFHPVTGKIKGPIPIGLK